jgi:acyl dehydratase
LATDETVRTRISNEALERLRKRVGEREGPIARNPITRSQIRHYGVMTGDMRPLFVDLEYARKGPWQSLIAPQGVLVHEEAFDPEVDGLPGCKAILGSADLEWLLPIRLADSLASETTLVEVEEVSQAAELGRAVCIATSTEVKNQEQRSVGTARLRWTCYERGSGGQRALYGKRKEPHVYEREDIEALGEEYKKEQPRGADSLVPGEVSVGDELQPVLKGPTTRSRYMGPGVTHWYWGHLQGFEAQERHPGVPGALEANTERVHHAVHLLMNWMGDAGFVRRLELSFPCQNMIGDVTRSYGRVTGKREEGDRGLVDLDIWQENQLGERITQGTARVALPLS